MNLASYAAHVTELAASRGVRFGDRKVFLASIPGWDATDAAMLAQLDACRRAGLLTFARADLVAAMDPALVAASEWRHPAGATFHFLVIA